MVLLKLSMRLLMNLERLNNQILIRREMRKHIKELEEELDNRRSALKKLESPKFMRWQKRQGERI